MLVATNNAFSPEMPLACMNEWIALHTGGKGNEIQWRYVQPTHEILDAIDAATSSITEGTTWDPNSFAESRRTILGLLRTARLTDR